MEGWEWGAQEGPAAGSGGGLTAGLSKNRLLVPPKHPQGFQQSALRTRGGAGGGYGPRVCVQLGPSSERQSSGRATSWLQPL